MVFYTILHVMAATNRIIYKIICWYITQYTPLFTEVKFNSSHRGSTRGPRSGNGGGAHGLGSVPVTRVHYNHVTILGGKSVTMHYCSNRVILL